MSSTPKLTKRQKKSIAFRDRRKESKGKLSSDDLENDVPMLEDQVFTESGFDDTQGSQRGEIGATDFHKERRRAEKTSEDQSGGPAMVAGKKRKREAGEAQGSVGHSRSKQRKGDAGDVANVEELVEKMNEMEKSKQRFILFLGNLKYTTTADAIRAHFSACDPQPCVRLLTPRPSATQESVKAVVKSKGCAFLEFEHRNALQQALKLHHSQLDGRRINVELTAGGGGKGAARLQKLKERNKGLEGQRRKRQEKSLDNIAPNVGSLGEAQRYSTTSGAEPLSKKKRTWTVGNVQESKVHRGGRKRAQGNKQGSRMKHFGTGVNAIPVG